MDLLIAWSLGICAYHHPEGMGGGGYVHYFRNSSMLKESCELESLNWQKFSFR